MKMPVSYTKLGATVCDGGVNFAVYSKHAEKIFLCLFKKDDDKLPYKTIELDSQKNKTGDIWHIFVENLEAGALYLFKADGPYNPPAGHRFNIHKYLFDPYAKAFTKGSVFLSYNKQREMGLAGVQDGELFDLSDFPKCVAVADDDFDWEGDKPLNYPLNETIIYETHVKGFTAHSSSGVEFPGTYKGFTEKVAYLKSLGITSVEFLPLFEFDENEVGNSNPRTGERLKNYWGYSTIGFFAPKTSYSYDKTPGGAVREFKEMVKALHKEGLEVILDVVYNHTAEGNENGYTFCFRGLDNSVYYMLPEHEKQYYMNYSGCGNTVNCNHPVTAQFILDSLRYWVSEMHVDGFRFDLASILARGENGAVEGNPYLTRAISEDPVLANTKIIAEPWDCGGAYHLGNFPGGRWSEWNGRFRDDIRRFIRGDENTATQAATRIAGSSDFYHYRSPLSSINFVTAHDGFTLNDLVSYNYKHNEENGEENRDGSDDNLSYNHGYEGACENPKIEEVRLRKIKNFLIFLMISEGVPMLLAGDEMRRTQNGNNNAYCQDSPLGWIDWSFAEKNSGLVRFTSKLIELRKKYEVFRRKQFFDSSAPEIVWYDSTGKMPDWSKTGRFLAFKMTDKSGKEFYIASNMDRFDLTITLPAPSGKKQWYFMADTSFPSPDDFVPENQQEKLQNQRRYVLLTNSMVVLEAR